MSKLPDHLDPATLRWVIADLRMRADFQRRLATAFTPLSKCRKYAAARIDAAIECYATRIERRKKNAP